MIVHAAPPTSASETRPAASAAVAYCGFTDTANVGDYALFVANQRLFPGLSLFPGGERRRAAANLFGGGTMYPYSLRHGMFPSRRVNVAIGLGVEDPAFAGRFGPLTRLAMWRHRFKLLGVRGYRSEGILAANGVRSVVTGDTALALERPAGSSPRDAVGVAVVGEPMHRLGDPARTRAEVVGYCRRVLAEGLEVVLMPFCRHDVAASRDIQAACGGRPSLVDFWSPRLGENLDAFLFELSRLRFMVGERLHAAVLAAAMDVPFVALPYKPKCLDFVESLKVEQTLTLDYETTSAGALWRRTRHGLEKTDLREAVAGAVKAYRAVLRQTAEEIRGIVLRAPD